MTSQKTTESSRRKGICWKWDYSGRKVVRVRIKRSGSTTRRTCVRISFCSEFSSRFDTSPLYAPFRQFSGYIPLRACPSFHPACFQVRNRAARTPEADSVHDCPSTVTEARRCWRDRHRSTISSGRNYRDEGHDRYLSLLPYKMCKGRGWSKHRPVTERVENNPSTLAFQYNVWRKRK